MKWKQLNYRKSEQEALGNTRGVRQLINHFENNMEMCSKAGLLRNMLYYCDRVLEENVFDTLPLTYNVTSTRDAEFLAFCEQFEQYEARKVARFGPKLPAPKPEDDSSGEEEDE